MLKILATHLAEALAELIHERVRKEIWGYAKEENLELKNLFRCKYHGIRPAPGYPACPDHSEKKILFDLLDVEKNCGIKLTKNYSMSPLASICGFYFSHPGAKYFNISKISKEQVENYSGRKNENVDFTERNLVQNLNY